MSTASREEAIAIVMDELDRQMSPNVGGAKLLSEIATNVVDKLLETHAISRNAPRILKRSDDAHPAAQVARAGQKPNGVTQV